MAELRMEGIIGQKLFVVAPRLFGGNGPLRDHGHDLGVARQPEIVGEVSRTEFFKREFHGIL
ncbi:hypothetical protein GCM10007923_28680 [Shinella yambaruensis]|uniref:Uncharacterized protein n=1 Tax=Shinella yambaruensis TaxID=415996 RepID=A0ABQ5ZFS0_9HYPH|nr:hypothetical protein GCM10007923_28680 [Shinella yambaruensis]